jgi:alkylation response protein AidB-like acyl-CoA dehydrogenase
VALNGLGIARAALDEFIALTASKTPSYAQTGLADRSVVQDGVARANAQIEAARSYIYACVSTAWEYVQDGSRLSAQEGIPLALAATFGLESAVKAVRIVHDLAGTSAIRNEQPFQQHFRDVHTISQHAFAATSRFESVGKLLLGRPSDWPLYYV